MPLLSLLLSDAVVDEDENNDVRWCCVVAVAVADFVGKRADDPERIGVENPNAIVVLVRSNTSEDRRNETFMLLLFLLLCSRCCH